MSESTPPMLRCARLALSVLVFAAASTIAACDDPVGAWDQDPPSNFVEVSAGDEHTCAIAADGTLWCWGRMSIGRLGYASGAEPCDGEICVEPVPVYGKPVASVLSAGGEHNCAIVDGGAYCWGYAFWGQLGDARSVYQRCQTPHANGPLPCSIEPFPIALGFGVSSLTAGANHSCVVTDGGAGYCFGLNQFGQTGSVGADTVPAPAVVQGDHVFRTISAGISHTCGVDTSGAAWCWGANAAGTLGNNQFGQGGSVPVPVQGDVFTNGPPFEWRTIDAGGVHTCGVIEAGEAYCWGLGGGRLGTLDGITWAFPVQALTPDSVEIVSISAGGAHSCALTERGRIYCFGENTFGQLGDGSGEGQLVPSLVQSEVVFRRVSAGARHTCAIDTQERLYCWGNNDWGQLGTGDHRGARFTPVRVRH